MILKPSAPPPFSLCCVCSDKRAKQKKTLICSVSMETQAGYSLLPHPSGFCVMSTGKSRVGFPAPLIATIMLPTSVRNKERRKEMEEAEGEEKIYCKCSLVLIHKGGTMLV